MHNRRNFIKLGGLAGFGLAGANIMGFQQAQANTLSANTTNMSNNIGTGTSIIGDYGPWSANLNSGKLPSLSFRNSKFKDVRSWQAQARKTVLKYMSVPDIGGMPKVTVEKQYTYDGLHIEELSWQLPYGRATKAILLKPEKSTGKLPGVLAFHCHGGNKYFGTEKITKTSDNINPLMQEHHARYYEGRAWANELAKKGYVVLVPDAFTFASRRVMLEDVPEVIREGLTDADPQDSKKIDAYNKWASNHEHIMAKSLFSAGTTWPSVFYAEDKKALDILCSRTDVDASRIGCGGLSGGGIRTDYMAGLDSRIKCSVSVGFMTTWKDLILNKSYTHTWMTYVPQLPNDLEFAEILGMRAPSATLVLNDEADTLFTLPEMKAADNILKEVFEKAGAPEKYKCSFYPGPHKFDIKMQEEAFAWWDKWLKA